MKFEIDEQTIFAEEKTRLTALWNVGQLNIPAWAAEELVGGIPVRFLVDAPGAEGKSFTSAAAALEAAHSFCEAVDAFGVNIICVRADDLFPSAFDDDDRQIDWDDAALDSPDVIWHYDIAERDMWSEVFAPGLYVAAVFSVSKKLSFCFFDPDTPHDEGFTNAFGVAFDPRSARFVNDLWIDADKMQWTGSITLCRPDGAQVTVRRVTGAGLSALPDLIDEDPAFFDAQHVTDPSWRDEGAVSMAARQIFHDERLSLPLNEFGYTTEKG